MMTKKQKIVGVSIGTYVVGTLATLNSMDVVSVAPLDVVFIGAIVGVLTPAIPDVYKWYKKQTKIEDGKVKVDGEYKTIRETMDNLNIEERTYKKHFHFKPNGNGGVSVTRI